MSHLKTHLVKLQKAHDAEVRSWKVKIDAAKQEIAQLNKVNQITEAQVISQQKVNHLKGRLIELQEESEGLQSELKSLRNIKENQFTELEKQANLKNFPKKIKDLIEENNELKQKQKELEEKMKLVALRKKNNFEDIVKVEDEIKAVKAATKKKTVES